MWGCDEASSIDTCFDYQRSNSRFRFNVGYHDEVSSPPSSILSVISIDTYSSATRFRGVDVGNAPGYVACAARAIGGFRLSSTGTSIVISKRAENSTCV